MFVCVDVWMYCRDGEHVHVVWMCVCRPISLQGAVSLKRCIRAYAHVRRVLFCESKVTEIIQRRTLRSPHERRKGLCDGWICMCPQQRWCPFRESPGVGSILQVPPPLLASSRGDGGGFWARNGARAVAPYSSHAVPSSWGVLRRGVWTHEHMLLLYYCSS